MNITDELLAQGYSIVELAQLAGCTIDHMRRVVKGQKPLSRAIRYRLPSTAMSCRRNWKLWRLLLEQQWRMSDLSRLLHMHQHDIWECLIGKQRLEGTNMKRVEEILSGAGPDKPGEDRCLLCEILLSESGDALQSSDEPGVLFCQYCRKMLKRVAPEVLQKAGAKDD